MTTLAKLASKVRHRLPSRGIGRVTYCLGGRLRRGPYLRGARSAVLLGCPRVTGFTPVSPAIGHATGTVGQAEMGGR